MATVFPKVLGYPEEFTPDEDTAIITPPQARNPAVMRKLDAVAGRVL